tara:strand:- start:516 stop:827 length:312 start_codon:yes stop_codon:yes gene_type:complete
MFEEIEYDKVNGLKGATAGELDDAETLIRYAESLLGDPQFKKFVRSVNNSIINEVMNIKGHTQDDNNRRVALNNQLTGINKVVEKLQDTVKVREKLVNQRTKI